MILEFLKNYWKALIVIISFISLLVTLFKSLVNSITLNKIRDNHLAHMEKDIVELKKDEKELKKEIKKELHCISLAIRRIERKTDKRDAICEERHSQKDR